MIATLFITVCLNLSICQQVELPLDDGVACASIGGQIAAQLWLDDHPKWQFIPGWRCRYGVPERKA